MTLRRWDSLGGPHPSKTHSLTYLLITSSSFALLSHTSSIYSYLSLSYCCMWFIIWCWVWFLYEVRSFYFELVWLQGGGEQVIPSPGCPGTPWQVQSSGGGGGFQGTYTGSHQHIEDTHWDHRVTSPSSPSLIVFVHQTTLNWCYFVCHCRWRFL